MREVCNKDATFHKRIKLWETILVHFRCKVIHKRKKKHEKRSSKNAPRKRSLSRRVQSVIFEDSYTLSAVFSGAWGYQNGVKMEAKMEQKGIQRDQVAYKIVFFPFFSVSVF